jgi:hypothetical protein
MATRPRLLPIRAIGLNPFATIEQVAEQLRQPIVHLRVYRLEPGQCQYCDQCRDDKMMPSHTASERCESGKRPHCACDTCY